MVFYLWYLLTKIIFLHQNPIITRDLNYPIIYPIFFFFFFFFFFFCFWKHLYPDGDFNDIFASNPVDQQSGDYPVSPADQDPVSPAAAAYLDEQSILEQLRQLQREEDSGLIQGLTGLAENMGITTGK